MRLRENKAFFAVVKYNNRLKRLFWIVYIWLFQQLKY